MAKKLKFNTNGPSFGQRLLDEEMATFTSKTSNKGASLPLSYGLNEYATEDVKIPETKEKMPDQIQQEESEMTEDYSIGTQLWESTAKLGLEVGLTKKKDELLETEARWVPQIELAKQYLQLRQQIESFPTDSPLTQEQRDIVYLYTRLENEVKNNAKTNPYLQDIFYLTLNSISHVPTLKDLSIFGKTIANEVREQNIFDLNPKNNIKTLLSQSNSNGLGVASLTKEEEEYLWDNKQNELGWQKLLELLDGASKKANEQYNDKTQSIINRENVLKKGNWFYDPSMLTKSFLNKVDTNILLWDKPKSWLYALPQVGSSFSEITAMSGQVLTSIAARTSAKVLAPEASAAIAIGEAAVNLFLAKYQRESETASEVFDNYTQKVLDQSDRNNINVVRVLEQWEPRLQSLGYDTLNMDDNEKLTTGMAQGLTTDQPVFENIRKDAFDGLQLVRTTNDALSYIDYFLTLPVSYGGSMLWKEANKGLAKVRGLDKAVYTDKLMKGIEVKKDLLPRVVDKTLNRLSRITTKNDALAIKNKNLIKNVAKIGKVLGINYFGESTEEGVQYLTGDKYQKGLYDYNKEMADSPMNAFFEMLDLGLEANLAYRGLSDDNYLNTDQLLKENMAVGGFISLVMPLSVYGSARLIKNATRNYKSDKIVSAMIAKNYANAELDQKAQTYYDALKKGKELSYITDYLEQVKENKLNGVTDDMIDNDIKLANKIYQFNHNSMINENLKMMGIKKGSNDHRNLVKSYAHIDERFNNANKDSERSKMEYDKLVDSQKSDEDDIYNQFIETLYQHDSEVKKLKNKLQQELKSKEIEQARLDLESLRNSYSPEESEIEIAKQKISEKLGILDKAREDLQFLIDHANDEIDKTKFFNTVRSIQLLNSRAKVLNDLDKMLSKRHKKLNEVKDKLGLNVNTRNISNIRDIISDLRQTNERDLKRLEEENGGKLPLLQDFSNQKEIDNAYASFVLNDAISNVLHNQRQAFITGKLSTNKYFNIKGITWNDLTEELKKNIIDDYTKFDVENGRPAPSLASIRTRYNNSQTLKKQKMLDRADTEELQRELANEIMQENVSKLSKDEVTATEEKILEGTLLPDDKQSEEIDNENPSETAKTNTLKLAAETEKPIEDENKPSVEATPQDKIEQSSEVTEDKVEKVYSNMDDFFKDVEKENEKQIIRNDLTEEEGKESAEEWEGISDDKEKDKIIAQNERVDDITKEEAKNNKAEFEDIDTKDESVSMPKGESTPDPVQIEEHINNDNSVETPIIGEKTEEELKELDAKDKKLVDVSDTTPSKPITIVDNTDPNQSVMEITDGGLIINNTFISDDTLIQIEDLSSDYEQTFGETGYYNVHPSKISENNDAIGNKRTLKVKHVSNTFFFQSNSTEPMNITVDGKKVVFRNDKGDELNVLPGKELSNRLIKKGWIDGVKSYYIVTNHVFGDPDRYAQAIHLVMEDKDGVFIASLRLPSYVDNEIRSNNYGKDELDELQKQKELLIALRKLITDAYLGNDSKVPLEIRKTVKPLNLRISNGQFNNQKELDDTPIRQNLSGVKDLGIPENDVIAIDAMIKNNDIEIGYGTGDIAEYVLQPNVIRKLGSDEELTDTQGKAKTGMLYLIPKPSLTPNGQVAPIQLNSLKFTDGFDSENVLSKDGSNKSLAELIYDLLTSDRIGYKGQLLDFLINHGGKTFVSKEVGEKYPFLELKMLYCGEVEGQGKRIMFVVKNSNGTQTRVAFDPSTATDRQKRVAIKAIADNFHWNTDKMSLLEELPPAIVEAARSYFKNYPNKKQFKMLGYDSLTFTREDVGLTGKPVVSQLAWMINTGKVQTDLGEHIYRDPFIYSDGVKTISLEEKQSIESQLKKAQETKAKEKKSRSKEEKPKQEEASVNKNEILSEDWTEDQIKDWMKLNAPRLKYTVGGWLIVKFASDGRIKAVRNVPKDGATLASTNKGEGKLNIEESKKWLEETLGISANDVVITDAIMRAANLPGDIYGALKVMMNRMNDSLEFKMFLSEEAGEGVQYHEGFHYVSRLLLSENTRRKLYQAYVKYNRNLKDASVREVEEAMAEDYRRYQLQKDKSPLLFNIKQIFKSIARAIGFMRDSRIVEQLYNKISKKEFAKYAPTEENMEQMRLELGNDLYYYIPGVTEKQIKNIPSITDANTFYKVVDALNSYVIGQFSLNSIDSLKDLATNIDDIFEMLSDEVEMGLHEDNELVIKDVIKNKDLFINQIDIYLSNFGITRTKVKNTLKSDDYIINKIFSNNPELSEIGSSKQYELYINTIFPDSKVNEIYWHGSESDFSDGYNTAKKTPGSGAPETGSELYLNKQPWASLQYLPGVNTTAKYSGYYDNWVKLWWELKEALGNGRLDTDEWKNEIIGPDTRQYSPNKYGVFNRDKGGPNGKYLKERKAKYGYENETDKEFFEEIFGIKYGKETFNQWVERNKKEFQRIFYGTNNKNLYAVKINVQNPIVERGQNTYYEPQRGLFTKAKKEGNDAIISNEADNEFGSDVIVLLNPKENAHFLGSKQDIEGFRNYVKNQGEESVVVETKKLDAESKEETEMEAISTGDQADNTWDKESYTINKKENVALNAKLFFFSIPSMKRITQPDGTRVLVSERDEFLGTPKSVSFDIVWAKVLDHLWNINSYQDMLDKCLKFGKTDEFFLVVYDKLTSKENPIDEVTKTLIYNTVKSSKNSMITLDITKILDTIERINTNTIESDVQMSDRDIQRYNENKPKEPAKYNITVLESDFFSKISSLPKIWSTTFFLSDLVTSNDNGDRIIDRNKFSTLVWKNKLRIDQLLGKNIDNSNFQEVKEKFVNMCNNLGIQMDNQCLEYMLYKYYGSISIDSMKKFWNWGRGGKSNAFTTILKNMYLASEKGWSGMKSKQNDKKARTFDRMFTSKNKNNQINIFAEAWGTLNPSPDVLTVTGADGNLVYVQSENNHMSDQLNWLKNDLHGKRDLIKRNAYSSNSMIIQQIEIDASAVKLNTYLNLKENISNTNRDFFGISSIEDYLSKMAFGFNDHIFSPTMSDKKTYHTISGMKMFKEIVWGNHVESVPDESGQMVDKLVPVGRRFSERLLNRFAMYLEDEYNAIVKYQASKLKVMNNDNLRVDNYFGSKKNHYADGNGGRFRYFNVIKLDGKILHLNEMLAKAEYDGNEQAYSDILNTVRSLFTDKKIDKNGNTTYGETVKRVVNGVLLAYCDKEISKVINLGVIDESLKSKILPDVFVKEFDKIAESASKTNNAVITEKDKIYSMIASTAINSAVSIIEIEKCFTGDPALYKWQKQFTVYKPNDDSFKETSAENLDDFFKQENKKREKEGLEPLTNEEKLQYSGYFKIIGRDVDKTKRLSSVLSTGTNLRTEYGETRQEELNTDSSFKVLHLTDRMIGSTVYDKLYNMFRTSLIKEMYQKEYGVTDTQALKAVKDQHGVDSTYGRLSKEGKAFVDAQAKASAKPYSDGEINQADAAVYIRPEFYKRMMKDLGQWSDEIEEAYDIMERNDDWLSDPELYNKATKAVTLPLKMTYFGDHYDENLLMNVNTYNKMALFPLFRSFAKADNKALYDRMNKKGQEIDMAIFESAIKVGGRKKFDTYTEKGFNIEALNQDSDVNGSTGKGLAVYTLDLNLIRLQLNTEPHEHKNRAMGTLAVKIGLANIVDERPYGNNKGLSIKGSDIKKNIYDCIKKLSQIGKQEVYDEFFTDGKSDDKKIAKYILKQAKDSGMPLELLEGLKLKKGLITLPVEALSIRSWIQTKVSSLINKAIVDINTPGGSAIQMSSFGYEAVGREVSDDQSLIDAFNGGKKLKFLAEEGHMLVLLSSRFFEDVVPEEYLVDFQTMRRWLIDNGVIGSRVLDNEQVDAKPYGIGYRIPTQGLSSMFAFHVADIMPKTIGDTIVVPEEFTAMTGSDFDVDKLYLATYAYKDGMREQSFVDSKEGYVNKMLDNYSLVLTDFTNIAETRASIDTLTSLLKKEILPLVLKANTEEALPMYELSPAFQVDRKNQYSSGKFGIAPFALNSTNHALTQSVHLSIKYGNKNRYGLLPLDSVTGEDYQRIMDWLSAMINAHVDVAKDPYIMTLNVNKVTYNMVSLLLRGGKGQNAFYFLAQPILKYYAKQVLENQGVIGSKDVSKDELLNDLIKQQGKYLKSRIESLVTTTEEESNLKNRMILKFNSICDKFSTSKILTDLEDIDVEYDIVFDKEYSKLGLANDDSLECIYQNLMSAIAFRELLGDTERLSKLVQLSKVDTKKYGNTLSTLLDYQRRLHRFIDQNADYFYNTSTKKLENALSSYFSQTFLGYKLSDAMFMSRNMLHKQVIEATKPYKKIFNAAMDFFVGEYTDNDTLNDISNSIVTSLRSKAITTFAVNMLMTDDEFKRMIYGRNSIAKRLFRLKNYLRNTNKYSELAKDGIIYNELLNYLQEYPGDGETLITDLIKTATNAMSVTSTYKSKLVSAFSDLLNSENQNIKNFANDLVKYAFYTSFDNNSPNGFFDLVPISWKIWNNYVGAITKLLFGLNSNNFGILLELGFDSEKLDSGNYTEILTDIVRNMYMNDKIASPYTFSNSDNKYNMYAMSGIKRLSMPYYFTSTKTRGKDYIKILKSLLNPNEFLVYQKIAESFRVDKEGAVIKNSTRFIYKVIPVYGMKDDKINYREFNKLPSEKSAFRLNAFPENLIVENDEIFKNLKDRSLGLTEREGSEVVFKLTDAIKIQTQGLSSEYIQDTSELGIQTINDVNLSESNTKIIGDDSNNTLSVSEEITDDTVTVVDASTLDIANQNLVDNTESNTISIEEPIIDITNADIISEVNNIRTETIAEDNVLSDEYSDDAMINCRS